MKPFTFTKLLWLIWLRLPLPENTKGHEQRKHVAPAKPAQSLFKLCLAPDFCGQATLRCPDSFKQSLH
jgi:hypothetical protein